ncbi:MAG: hypothetical protein LC679_15530, partial [Intrasporangiaceae bacterium]|nr:hypothetical protein [Intrasporangiaceae bacterium]
AGYTPVTWYVTVAEGALVGNYAFSVSLAGGNTLDSILVTVFASAVHGEQPPGSGEDPPVDETASVVIASSAGTKTVGYDTYVWGTVTESGEQDVWTEVEVGGAWSRSQDDRTDSEGDYVLELTYGFTTVGEYRFRVGSLTSGGVVYSDPFTLTRTPWQPSWAGTKPVGQTTYVWATMPRAANRSVFTEVLVSGQWSRSQDRIADTDGYFAIPLTYGINTVGEYTFRVGASTAMGTVYSSQFILVRTASNVN